MPFLGLDISKDTIDACLVDERTEAFKKVPNNSKGFEQLKRWVTNRRAKDAHVCLEFTGAYSDDVADDLTSAGYLVSVINPAQIKSFAQSRLVRAKTDKVDAAIIAAYCRAQRPPPWTPPPPQERKLRGLVRFRGNLVETRASFAVQRQTPNIAPEITRSIDDVIDNLDDQISNVEDAITKLIDSDDDLRKRRDLLCSIQGISDTTAATMLAEMPRMERFDDAKAVSAFAGLSPRTKTSGTSVKGGNSICKIGSARLRAALWCPGITALKCNPRIRALGDRMAAAGKPKKKIIVAAMRKLLVLAYGVLKSGRAFDEALTTA